MDANLLSLVVGNLPAKLVLIVDLSGDGDPRSDRDVEPRTCGERDSFRKLKRAAEMTLTIFLCANALECNGRRAKSGNYAPFFGADNCL